MDEITATDSAAIRAAAYLATKERLDFRRGKTRSTVKCNSPNVKCGNRCIPPEWSCRLKGEGSDPHLAASRTDPVSGLANIERGLKRLGNFARTGSFSELESSKRSFVRGAVKIKPGNLKEKTEFKNWLEDNWLKIVIPVSVAAGGLAIHSGLKGTNVFNYRKGAGAKIDEAVGQGIAAVLDRTPVVGQARAYTRKQAEKVATANLSRIAGRTQRQRSYKNNPSAGIASTTIPRSWATHNTKLSEALRDVDSKARSTTFYEWNTKHGTAFWGATNSAGVSIYATPTAHSFMSKEWGLNLTPTNIKSDYITAIANRIQSDRDALLRLAKQQGFTVYGRPGSEYLKNEDRDAFISRFTSTIKNTRQRAAQANYVEYAVGKLAPSSAARTIYDSHVEFFDKYYKTQSNDLITVAGAPDFDAERSAKDQFRKNVLEEQPGLIELRKAAERRRIDYLMQVSNKPNSVSKGTGHDELFLRDYYHTKVVGNGKSPYTISDRLAVQAASELSGKQGLTPTQAIQLLNNEYGFKTAQVEIRPGPRRRSPSTGTPEGGRPARRRTPAQQIAAMMRQKNPDGTPRYASREAAQAEYERRRAQYGNRDDEEQHFTPRITAYLDTIARLDKRCGKSGIPEKAKCTKNTPAQSEKAANRAKGAAQPGLTCFPPNQKCGNLCIPPTSTCHIKSGGGALDKAAKIAAVAGGVASVVGAVRNRKTIVRTTRQGTLRARRSLRTNNRELYRRTAVRARVGRRVANNVVRTQTQQTVAELSKRTIKTLSTAEVDTGISRLPKNFQDPVRRLVGDAKISAAHLALKAKGGRITSVNNTDNFSNWQMRDGTLLSTGSVGETLIIYNTKPQDSIGGARTYSTQFRVDGEFDAKSPAASRNARGVASTVKKMFQSQMEQIPDNSIITAIPYANDNKGKKRRSIYERYGFRQALSSDERLFAMKTKGNFTRMKDSHIEQIADLIRNDARTDSTFSFAAIRQQRFDFTPSSDRKGKPCGKSFVPKNANCTKPASAKYAEQTTKSKTGETNNTIRNVAIAGAATGVTALALIGARRNQVSAYRRNVPKSALEAEKLAIEFERQMREQAAARLKKRVQDVTGYEASVYNYNDKGFERGFSPFETDPKWYGQTKQSKGGLVVLSYADEYGKGGYNMVEGGAFRQIWGDRDPLPFHNAISQPVRGGGPDNIKQAERRKLLERAEKVGGVPGKSVVQGVIGAKDAIGRFKFLRDNVNERGFNPDSIRLAGFLVAQRRLTGKPVDILAYSNGGSVATEALAILAEMGYKDVKVLNVAGPTFGMFQHKPENMRTFVSKGDEFYKVFGDNAFKGGNTTFLKNDNIPHGLEDALDPNNPAAGNVAENRRNRRSYTLDAELRNEGYKFLTVDKTRSRQLEEEILFKITKDEKFSGDLEALYGEASAATFSRYKKMLSDPRQREEAKRQIRSEIEDRMLEVWYGGYNPNKVKNTQKAIRKELQTYIGAPTKPVQTRRPLSLSQRAARIMEQNPDMSKEAALRQARREQVRSNNGRSDAYNNSYYLVYSHLITS